eukprot:1639234-Amphidinium_carterae.1
MGRVDFPSVSVVENDGIQDVKEVHSTHMVVMFTMRTARPLFITTIQYMRFSIIGRLIASSTSCHCQDSCPPPSTTSF